MIGYIEPSILKDSIIRIKDYYILEPHFHREMSKGAANDDCVVHTVMMKEDQWGWMIGCWLRANLLGDWARFIQNEANMVCGTYPDSIVQIVSVNDKGWTVVIMKLN